MSVRMFAAFAALAAPAVLLASVAAAQQPQPAPAQTPAPAPAADPKAMLDGVCSGCHGVDFITEHRKSHDDWAFTVRTMIDRGAELDPDSAAILIDYLAKTYPADPPKAADKPSA